MPPATTRAALRRAPGRDLELMQSAEKRLTAKLGSFFAATARRVSKQLSERLARDVAKRADHTIPKPSADYVDHPVNGERCDDCTMFTPPDGCTLVEGIIDPDGHCRYWEVDAAVKRAEHTELHVQPENAEPIHGIPVADAVTNANVMHVSWEMVREGKTATVKRWVPMASLIAIQRVVDRQRVQKHITALLELGELEPGAKPPLVLLWDDDYFILGGHHGLQGAYDLGEREVLVEVMVAP